MGGTWYPGEDCLSFRCPEACCAPATAGCTDVAWDFCTETGGVPQGPGTACSSVTCPLPCDLICPAGGTPENESDCGIPNDTVNGGCNSIPPVFSSIACGDTVCGTVAFDATFGSRDTDWYEITVTQPTSFTWTVNAEFATTIGVVGTAPYGVGDCSASTGSLEPFAFGSVCGSSSVTVCVAPGTYWFFIAPDFTEDIQCIQQRKYVAKLTCGTCVTGACCRGSGVCDLVGGTTCTDLSGVYAGDGTVCEPNCCPQTPQGADDCATAVPHAVPVDGTPVTISGDNASATAGGACDTELGSIPIWWEAFSIDACADVLIDYCCTEPQATPSFSVLNGACPNCTLINSAVSIGSRGCAGDNLEVLWEGLPAGSYTYPIYSLASGSVHGPYQLHITAHPCTSGACCLDGTCIGTMSRLQCTELGGTWFDGEDCAAGYVCPGAPGACCDGGTGICTDGVAPASCPSPLLFTAGTACSDLNPPCLPPPTGACCVANACTGTKPETDCSAESGVWFDGKDCASFTCPLSPTCPNNTLYGQVPHLPSDAWSLGVSDTDWTNGPNTGALRYESFPALTEPICDVHWWGVNYNSAISACVENPMTFTIKFYDNAAAASVPGTEVCTYTVSTIGTPTGWTYINSNDLNEYHVDLPTCCPLSTGWVSIQATGGPDCLFWWLSSPDGDGKSCLQDGAAPDCSGTTWDTSYDLSVCLTGAPTPPEACCNPVITCADLSARFCTDSCPCKPDMNCDGALDTFDIDPFMVAMTDPAGYAATYPNCNIRQGDLDCDGDIDVLDLQVFNCLVPGTEPSTCIDLDPLSCDALGGMAKGPGTTCTNSVCPPVETDVFESSIGAVEISGPFGTEKIAVYGPAAVQVYFEGAVEGSAQDDDGNGLDEVITEMTQLELSGTSSFLGPVKIGLHPTTRSMGEIKETVNNTPGTLDVPPFTATGTADSFFDVFLQVDLPDLGIQLFTQDPKRLSATIEQKPPGPGALYKNGNQIQLYDGQGNATSYFLGACRHRPNPPIEVDYFPFSIGTVELTGSFGDDVIAVHGPATAHVFFEGANEGRAVDDNGNGLEEVITEMVQLELTGSSPSLGPVKISLHPTIRSMGEIEETVNHTAGTLDVPPFTATGTAQSFFDLFFQVDLLDQGIQLFARIPTRMSATIDHKPPSPGTAHHNANRIELFDENGIPTGAFLSLTRHVLRPVCTLGDVNDDGLWNLQDYAALVACLTGPMVGPLNADCARCFDYDNDLDIDVWDFGRFQERFTGTTGP